MRHSACSTFHSLISYSGYSCVGSCIPLLFIVSSLLLLHFFFFKQKTAYEMRISDWSSDVCSSDLVRRAVQLRQRLCTAFRAIGAAFAGHDDLAAEILHASSDSLVICRDEYAADARNRAGRLPCALDQRLGNAVRSLQLHQRLARVAGRGIARRDDDDCVHSIITARRQSWMCSRPIRRPSSSSTKAAVMPFDVINSTASAASRSLRIRMGSAVAMSDAVECQRRLTLRRISPSEIMPSMILSLTTIATPKDFSDMITTVSAMGVSGATMGSESPVCMRSATCTNLAPSFPDRKSTRLNSSH